MEHLFIQQWSSTRTMQGDYQLKPTTNTNSQELVFKDGVLFMHSDESGECPSLSTANNSTISCLVTELQQTKLSGVYKTKRQIASWTKSQVHELEKLVWKHGTDFAIIATFLAKDRDQVKRKFKQEQKKNNTFGFKQPE